jgi:D-glycero-D-manno-heptose 1,7-bisphosphate phosphatase
MIFKASRDFDIDIPNSFMIGDRISDLEAGRNAGCKQGFLVDSFYWDTHAPKARNAGFETAKTVLEAVSMVTSSGK